MVKNLPANGGDIDVDSIPESGRYLGGRHGNPSRILAWRIPVNRGAWQVTIYGVAKSQTPLSD